MPSLFITTCGLVALVASIWMFKNPRKQAVWRVRQNADVEVRTDDVPKSRAHRIEMAAVLGAAGGLWLIYLGLTTHSVL